MRKLQLFGGRQDDDILEIFGSEDDAYPVATIGGDGQLRVGTGAARPTGLDRFAVGAFSATERLPFASNMVLTGDSVGDDGATDVVGHTFQTGFAGDFSDMGGPNEGVIFGLNVFTYTSPTVDLDGVTSLVGGLVEASIRSGVGTSIPMVRGFQAEAAFYGASAAAHVDTIESLRVSVPKRKDGAVAGDADVVRTLYVEATPAGTLGSDEAYAVFVESGLSHFGGKVEVELQDAAEIGLRLRGFTSQTANLMEAYTVGDSRVFRLSAAGLIAGSSSVIAADGLTAQVALGAHGPGSEAAIVLGASLETRLAYRAAANILRLPSVMQVEKGFTFLEQTAPSAPAADRVTLYAVDNGSGKTQLMALFATGAAQQVAIQP